MKQVININFQGRVVPIEVSAFDILKQYTESLNRHFANEEGKEEIINDIESRIGELFQERLTNGVTCITDDDVNAVIKSMGRPEELEDASENTGSSQSNTAESSNQQYTGPSATHKRLYRDESNKILGGVCAGIANYFGIDALIVRILFVVSGVGLLVYILLWAFVPNNATVVIGAPRKKLYRDGDDKVIAGVCSGIGNYFGISSWIPRLLFALPFLSFVFRWNHWSFVSFPDFLRIGFSPGALIIYIILWLVVPEAFTTAEKLEMKGTKVDIDSIKNSVMEEMKGVQQKAQKFGKDASSVLSDKTKAFTAAAGNIARHSSRSFGDIIVLMLRIFAYFIIGIVGFGLVMGLFGLGIAAIGFFPLKDFIVTDGWENAFAWGTLLFFIAVPIIGIITWIIRKFAKAKGNRKIIRLSFGSLWVIGWISVTLLVASVSKDFYYNNKNLTEQDINLSNPRVNKLEITSVSPLEKYTHSRWLRFEPFAGLQDDTAYVKNFDVRIMKSPSDSFRVTIIKTASGRTRAEAENLAALIQFNGIQKDSVLQLDKGIAINKTDKFRNQRIILTIYVPVGKHIEVDRSVGWFNFIHFEGLWNHNDDWYFDTDDEAHGWVSNTEYEMKADGRLYTLDGREAGTSRHSRIRMNINDNTTPNNADNYRYDNGQPMNKVDSMREKLEKEQQYMKDSLEKAKEKIDNQLEKLGDNSDIDEPTGLNTSQLPAYGQMITIN
jgi:phage shock protein PspC (stress-responsive transcriptional regulator)